MAYDTYDFPDHEKGDTFEGVTFIMLINGVALDLTGAVIQAKFWKNGNAYTLSTTTGELTITDPAAGTFTFDKQIINFDAGNYCYEMMFTLASGDVKTYIKGTWKITR